MLIKILGGMDLVIGLILIFGAGITLPTQITVIIGMILLLKSCLGLLKDFGSWIDFSCGATFLFSILFSIPWIINLILGVLIIQKGIMSFL